MINFHMKLETVYHIMTLILLILAFTLLPALALQEELEGLKLVHLLYRHGDRTPIDPYPNDPYKDPSEWNVGFGQLTSIGKAQHFKLGGWLRKRYAGFLSPNYSEEEIHVRSTDVARTLMSAESNLAGLYPPKGYWKWNPQLDWQPIPVHTLPREKDKLLSSHAECPRFEQLQKELLQSEWMQNLYLDNKDLFLYISNHTGWNVTDIRHLHYIYDTLYVESVHNMTLPDWTKQVFPHGKFEKLRDISFIMDTFTHELKRLKGGPFVKEIISHFDDSVNGKLEPSNRKVFMYSGHDNTISSILNSLDVFDPIAPTYAALVMFELFDVDDEPYVKISYRNETERDPYVLTLPGCDAKCPLYKFKDITSSIIPSNWAAECSKPSGSSGVSEQVTMLIAAVSSSVMATVVVLAVLASLCGCRCKKKEQQAHRYRRVQELDSDHEAEAGFFVNQ